MDQGPDLERAVADGSGPERAGAGGSGREWAGASGRERAGASGSGRERARSAIRRCQATAPGCHLFLTRVLPELPDIFIFIISHSTQRRCGRMDAREERPG